MVRVYQYGALPPVENLPRVEEQISLAHRYYNTLVEIERQRRAMAPPRCPCGDPEEGRCRCETCLSAIRVYRAEKKAGARGGFSGHCTDEAWEARRRATMEKAQDMAAEAVRQARAESGVWWGSYLLQEQAIDAAKGHPTPPHFRSWWGEKRHRLGVQLQKGLPVANAFAGESTFLRLERVPDTPGKRGKGRTPGSRRAGQRAVAWLRIGSEGRAPVWTRVPFLLHRPLPPEGTIKWVTLCRTRVGTFDQRWSLHFTVEETDPVFASREGVVAVDLGWRVREEGFRAGYFRDDAGGGEELLLPQQVRYDLEHYRSIESIRDRAANEFLPRVARWLRANEEILPDWLRAEAEHIPQWKSADRLARLAARWLESRFPGDEAFVEDGVPHDRHCQAHLRCWFLQDRHLNRWEAHGSERALRWRDEVYKTTAARLARTYGTVVIEDFDLAKLAGRQRLPKDASGAEKKRADNASAVRHLVAPGRFRQFLVNACRKHGAALVRCAPEGTTATCAACGQPGGWDAAADVELTCRTCGATFDQDDLACRHLLRRHREEGVAKAAQAGAKSARQQRFARRNRASTAARP